MIATTPYDIASLCNTPGMRSLVISTAPAITVKQLYGRAGMGRLSRYQLQGVGCSWLTENLAEP